jgi:predicted helicase
MLPRIPLGEDVRNFWKFSKGGRQLAELHINYETTPPYSGIHISGEDSGFFNVVEMQFPKKGQQDTGFQYSSQSL